MLCVGLYTNSFVDGGVSAVKHSALVQEALWLVRNHIMYVTKFMHYFEFATHHSLNYAFGRLGYWVCGRVGSLPFSRLEIQGSTCFV